MAKFLTRLFSRGSSLRGSQTSLNETHTRSKTSSSGRTSASLENLASYHVIPKELEKNKLHKASWEGNLQKVQRLARPGQINLKDQQMRTPLHLAVVKGHTEIVQYLVQENAELGVLDNEQRTPLIKAVLSGNQNPQRNYQICEILVNGDKRNHINALDKHGRNALHYAIDFGNQRLVELFLSNENCDPNYQDRDQMTPLHLAIKRNSAPIVQLLLSNEQTDPNITNRYGQTPLHIAISVGYIDIVRLLLLSDLNEPCDPTILDSHQFTAYQVAKANHQEACAKLIEEYEEKRFKPELRRQTTTSINEQLSIKATSSISMTPAANLQRQRDETSEDSSSPSTNKPLKISPSRTKRASDQWSDENDPSIGASKPQSLDITGLFKTNPLQPNTMKTNTSSTLNNLFSNNPLQINSKKTTAASQQTKSSLFSGIGPVAERVDSDNTSTSVSINKSIKPAPLILQTKPVTSNQTVLQPTASAKSWSDDTITASPTKKQEPRSNSWDTSVSDDDTSISKPKNITSNLQKTLPFSPSTANLTSSDTDDNSVDTKIRKFDIQKPSNETTVDHSVNKQTGNGYKVIGLSGIQSPVSEDSSWTTSPVPFNEKLNTKGVHNLVEQTKPDESTWDDSRPLSADLKVKTNSNDSSSLVRSTGIENLVKIMNTIVQSHQKQTSPKVIGKLLVSSLADRTDSIQSENTLHEIDNDEDYEQSTNGNDSKGIRQLPRKNNLPSSKSPTKSSFNDVQINDLKESIKKLERNQEDARELKRQLKEMENKKNDFEKLYKDNDRLLRDIKNKLEQEKSEKERLEWTTENLNTELKNIKKKLQTLEDEKDVLNQRYSRLKEERDNHDQKLQTLQANNSHSSTTSSFHDDDADRINSRRREEMRFLSAENNDLHHRTKQLQSDLELHKESLDVTIRYKIDLEKALEEKTYFQHQLDRVKSEKDLLLQEKLEYQTKYNSLQDEIRLILFDRSKLEQKLTGELQEHFQEKQRSTDDLRKYRTQIEQLNIKLSDAEARLVVLQTQKDTLLTSKDRDATFPQRVSDQFDTAPHHQQQQQEHSFHEPRVVLTSTYPKSSKLQHNDELNRTFPSQQHTNGNYLIENSRQIRSDTERVKSELDRLRQDFDTLVSHYEPTNNFHQQTQLHSQIDTFRQFYEHEFRQRQSLMSKLTTGITPTTINNSHHNQSLSRTSTNSRLFKERLETAIDTSLADQRLQTIQQLPRQASALLTINTTNNGVMSSIDLLRKHYHV